MSWRAVAALAMALGAVVTPPVAAFKGCAESLVGQSLQPPAALWGAVEPTSVLVNATSWTGSQRPSLTYNISTTVDIENGWLFVSNYDGLSIWDARTDPANPSRTVIKGGFEGQIPHWVPTGEFTQVVFGVDAPEGIDTIIGLAAMPHTLGFTIWDTTNKSNPLELYQDSTRGSYQVYADRIGGRDYAFVADFIGSPGLYRYDMTAARSFSACGEATPTISCPGVFKGRIGSAEALKYVHGLVVGSRHFVVTSGGDTTSSGIRIWEVTNPDAPVEVVHDFQGYAVYHATHGVAMWTQDGHHYLAARHDNTAKIFDVTDCLTTGCTDLQSRVIWSQALRSMPEAQYWMSATFSRSGNTPFVFFGHHDVCVDGEAPGHKEMLYDVTTAAQPREVSPPQTIQDQGETVDYWSWYSSDTIRGFAHYAPRVAKFYGAYLYRAAATIFDVHKYTGPPAPDFSWSPQPVYAGDPIQFTNATTGGPTSYSWSFESGTAASAPSGATAAPASGGDPKAAAAASSAAPPPSPQR
ncbi:MAG TPA: hypothetical protein VGS57_13620 [Thermoanaerobaculia bacterium]|nr:hypothetical protein [Thermoanaerobaculia bacterium]